MRDAVRCFAGLEDPDVENAQRLAELLDQVRATPPHLRLKAATFTEIPNQAVLNALCFHPDPLFRFIVQAWLFHHYDS